MMEFSLNQAASMKQKYTRTWLLAKVQRRAQSISSCADLKYRRSAFSFDLHKRILIRLPYDTLLHSVSRKRETQQNPYTINILCFLWLDFLWHAVKGISFSCQELISIHNCQKAAASSTNIDHCCKTQQKHIENTRWLRGKVLKGTHKNRKRAMTRALDDTRGTFSSSPDASTEVNCYHMLSADIFAGYLSSTRCWKLKALQN